MCPLNIYKASAGSGKTFALTLEYLKLLFRYPGIHRHILAVTFTNKAAGEMKHRILSCLHDLSRYEGGERMEERQALVTSTDRFAWTTVAPRFDAVFEGCVSAPAG